MLFLDHFFIFMGKKNEFMANGEDLVDPRQYVFIMKDMQVKSEHRIHHDVRFLQKNTENPTGNKYLLSLGYDYGPTKGSKALVLKIWDFESLISDEYAPTSPNDANSLTGGTWWQKQDT